MASVSFELQKPILAQFEDSLVEATSRWDKIGVLKKEIGGYHTGSYFHRLPLKSLWAVMNTLSLCLDAAEH